MSNKIMKPTTKFGTHIQFTPYAWAKLLYMRDKGPTEVAGYGITATDDPLLVTDFVLVKQECTVVTFDLDANDSVEHMETMMDKGLMPWQYANILIHTHPGDSPSPSGTDENNFNKSFSHPNWAVMFIIAEGGECYCRLKINVGPGSIRELDVCVDWSQDFEGTNKEDWATEYSSNVKEIASPFLMTGLEGTHSTKANSFQSSDKQTDFTDIDNPLWWIEEENRWTRVSELEEAELSRDGQGKTEVTDELDIDCFWGSDGCVEFWSEESCGWYTYDPISEQWHKESDEVDEMVAIAAPDTEWAARIVEWACIFADERLLALED